MSFDITKLPYRTTFAAQIRATEPSEDTMREAKASLTDLKALLPEGVNPEDTPQLLYISANLYVAGMVNRNDDGVDIETSLAAYKGFEKQQINIEHDRGRACGFILSAGLSEFGTDRLISEDEARLAGRPFNVAVCAVLWKVNNPQLCSYLIEASNPLHPDYKSLSLSFEVGFSSYNVAVIDAETRVITEASKVYTPADAEYETMAARLRSNGGSGRLAADSTEGIYQILSGTFIPLGGGIVTAPAAAVKGITAITEPIHLVEDTEAECVEISITEEVTQEQLASTEAARATLAAWRVKMKALESILEKNIESHIKSTKTRVSTNTSNTITKSNMSKELLAQIKQKVASVGDKPEDIKLALAGAVEIAEAITNESVKLFDELQAEKNRGIEIEKNRAEAAAASAELATTLETVKAELADLRAAQAAADAAAKFDERMATIDDEFELDDEERALVIADVKSLDDAAFDGWMVKAKKIMKEKTKSFKKKQKDDKAQKFEDAKAAFKAKGISVTIDEDGLFKEIIASAQANNISEPIENVVETSSTKTLAERMKEEFMATAKIGGKLVSEYNKQK